jgi:hypothetical protein
MWSKRSSVYLIVVPVVDDVVVRDASLHTSHHGPRAAPVDIPPLPRQYVNERKCYAFTFSFLFTRRFGLGM